MSNYYQQFVSRLDALLHEKNVLTNALEKIETATNVKRVYIAQFFLGIVSIYMIFGYFAEFVCNAIGFLYPAYASIIALESQHKEDDTKWLTYWVVFAFFSVGEFFSDIIFSWFPFYWLAKVIFLIWCFMPLENNGSMYIYSRVIRPVFLKNRQHVDNAFSSAVGAATNIASKAYDGARKQE